MSGESTLDTRPQPVLCNKCLAAFKRSEKEYNKSPMAGYVSHITYIRPDRQIPAYPILKE